MPTFNYFKLLVMAILCTSIFGCSMGGRREVVVQDESGAPLEEVLVVPLYANAFAFNFGADGKPLGKPAEPELLITRPFLFDSGEDIVAKQIPSRGIILPIPPVVYIGSNHAVYRYLMLKPGYEPVVLTDHDVASKRWKPMSRASSGSSQAPVDVLLNPKPDQDALKRLMGAAELKQIVQVSFSPEEVRLLQSYRN